MVGICANWLNIKEDREPQLSLISCRSWMKLLVDTEVVSSFTSYN